MIIKELSEIEFNDFISKYPFSSIYQTVEYSNLMVKEGYSRLFIGGIEDGKLVAASLILVEKIKNFSYAYAPRGFLIDYTNFDLLNKFTTEIKKYLGKKDIVAVKLCPIVVNNLIDSEGNIKGNNSKFKDIYNNLKSLGYYHYGFNSFFEANLPRFEALIDLTLPLYDLYNNIKKDSKNKIKVAEARGFKIFKADINEIGYLYQQVKDKKNITKSYLEETFVQFSKHNKLDYYYAKLDTEIYLKTIKFEYEKQEEIVSSLNNTVLMRTDSSERILNKKIDADKRLAILKDNLIEATNLMREYPTGLVLSTIVVLKHHGEVTIFLDGYDKNYKQFNSKDILLWKIIDKYSQLGFKRLNLGGVTDPRVTSEKYEGLNKLKFNFNSCALEYIGDLELVTNKTMYFLYRQLVKPNK